MDERLMMTCPLRREVVSRMDFGGDGPDVGQLDNDRPYYYTLDRCILDTRQTLCVSWPQGRPGRPSRRRESRMRFLVDRAGALVERYCYESSGKPLTCPLRREVVSRVRESCGRGDFDHDTELTSDDRNRLTSAYTSGGSIWDPRGDLDDGERSEREQPATGKADRTSASGLRACPKRASMRRASRGGDVDDDDLDLYDAKDDLWAPDPPDPVVAQAFSDVGNPYMFQGVPHFALDTATSATSPTLPLNEHRARFNDPVTGRWTTRDSAGYRDSVNLYGYSLSNAIRWFDPFGLHKGDKRYGKSKEFWDWYHREIKPKIGNKITSKAEADYWEKVWVEEGKPVPGQRSKPWKKGRKFKGLGLIALGLLAEQALALNHVADSGTFRRLVDAIARGDLDEADRLAHELEQELIAAGFDKSGLNFGKAWCGVILPKLAKDKEKKQQAQGQRGESSTGVSIVEGPSAPVPSPPDRSPGNP